MGVIRSPIEKPCDKILSGGMMLFVSPPNQPVWKKEGRLMCGVVRDGDPEKVTGASGVRVVHRNPRNGPIVGSAFGCGRGGAAWTTSPMLYNQRTRVISP